MLDTSNIEDDSLVSAPTKLTIIVGDDNTWPDLDLAITSLLGILSGDSPPSLVCQPGGAVSIVCRAMSGRGAVQLETPADVQMMTKLQI